ncbi:MAG: lamin tail domain-containing protein, partial [Crenarchaeota archaeon]|nr:lamin tail domain-containing protein [Thermoproteota archaeon]
PDWIEIYNSGENIIDLSGMYLTNDLNHVKGWKIPKNTTIQAGEYLVIWADKNLGDHGLHANFALFANEGTIALYENDGETLVDCVNYEKQLRDVSYGRIPNGDSQWQYLTIPTPGAANQPNPKSNTTSSVYTITAIIVIIIIIAIAFLIINKRAKRRTNF